MLVVCGKISGKICGEMCGQIEKLSDWNKKWCGSRYGPHDYDMVTKDKKTKKTKKNKKTKRQKDKKTKRQTQSKRQKGKKRLIYEKKKKKNCQIETEIGEVVDTNSLYLYGLSLKTFACVALRNRKFCGGGWR